MNVQYTYKNIEETLKEEIEQYAAERLADISHLFEAYPDESILIKVTLEAIDKRTVFKGSISVEIKHGKSMMLHAEEAKHTYTEVIDLLKDKISLQVSEENKKRKDHNQPSLKDLAPEETDEF